MFHLRVNVECPSKRGWAVLQNISVNVIDEDSSDFFGG